MRTPAHVVRPPTGWLTALLVVWALTWSVVGVVTGLQIRQLRSYGDTLLQSSEALDTAGSALQTIGALPIVGDGPERLGDQIRGTAAGMAANASETHRSVELLSVLLGASIVLVPTVPLLAVFVPHLVARRRERRAIVTALRTQGEDPDLEEFLARRAVQHLPYATLRDITPTPWRDLAEGRFRLLANAELTRLGLARAGGLSAGTG